MRIRQITAVGAAATTLMFGAALPAFASGTQPTTAQTQTTGDQLPLALRPAPTLAEPTDSAGAATAEAQEAGGGIRIQATIAKKAKNVRGKPPRRAVCMNVHRVGGSPTFGKACFQPHGDRFWIKDKRADGYHINMVAMPTGNPQTFWECKNFKGKRAGWTRCSFAKSMKENTNLNFWVLAYKGSRLVGQSAPAPARS